MRIYMESLFQEGFLASVVNEVLLNHILEASPLALAWNLFKSKSKPGLSVLMLQRSMHKLLVPFVANSAAISPMTLQNL